MDRHELKEAFQVLMFRHGDAIYRYCRDALGDPVLAEDVRQQVFIEAFRDLARFAGRSSLRSWLLGIARHRVLDAARARARESKRRAAYRATAIPDPSPRLDERVDKARLSQLVVECLRDVRPQVQAAVLLRFHYDLTFEDMAAISCEKADTLRARVNHALPRLRNRVEARLGESP
jgi:RNA polymerase sigma-70 factor (ECF subfamily)